MSSSLNPPKMNQSKRMSKEQEEEVASRVNAILQMPANQICADCSVSSPQWASLLLKTATDTAVGGSSATTSTSSTTSSGSSNVLNGLGAVICEECAIHHMQQLGEDCTFLKYLCFHHEWTHSEELKILESTGNDKINRIYEAKCFRHNISRKSAGQQAKFIRDKYKKCRYYEPDADVDEEETDTKQEEEQEQGQEQKERAKPKKRKSAKENFMNFLKEKPDVVATEEPTTTTTTTTKPRKRKSAKDNFMQFLKKTNSCPSLNVSVATAETVPLDEDEAGSRQPARNDSNGSILSLCSSLDDSSHLSLGDEEEKKEQDDHHYIADSTMDSSEARRRRRRRRRRSPQGGGGGGDHRELRRWGSDPALLSKATKSMARAWSSGGSPDAPSRPRRHLSPDNNTATAANNTNCPKTPTEQGKVAAFEEVSDEFKMAPAPRAA